MDRGAEMVGATAKCCCRGASEWSGAGEGRRRPRPGQLTRSGSGDGALRQPVQAERNITLGATTPQFIALYARPKNHNWRDSERILNQKLP